MPRPVQDKAYTTFLNGIITETTGIKAPENAVADMDNLDLNPKGIVKRRLGLKQEVGGETIDDRFDTSRYVTWASSALSGPYSVLPTVGDNIAYQSDRAVTAHLWPNPNGRTDLNLLVVQIGNALYIRDADQETISAYLEDPSRLAENFKTLDHPTEGLVFKTSSVVAARTPLQSAVGFGRIWFTSPAVVPFYLEYSKNDNGLVWLRPVGSAENSVAGFGDYFGKLQMRDYNGVKDFLRITENPTTITPEHIYNLQNQGWDQADHIAVYFADQSNYPSNAQQWVLGKDANDDFDPSLLVKQDFGNSPAPKGRAIIDVLLGDRGTAFDDPFDDVVLDPPQNEPSSTGFRTVAFYAGRLWLAGDANASRPNGVYYSKTIRNVTDAAVFMQENDPTSEEFTDLLDTDGGVFYLTEAVKIQKLVPYSAGLLVFAENGIWYVYGGNGGSFTATSISLERISTVGCVGAGTVVQTEQGVGFWSENSIQMATLPSQGTVPVVVDLASEKIFSLYSTIPLKARANASGVFDRGTKKIIWSYLSFDTVGATDQACYNRMLIFDTRTAAFSRYSFVVGASIGNRYYNGAAIPLKAKVTVNGDDVALSIKLLLLCGEEDRIRVGELAGVDYHDYGGTLAGLPSDIPLQNYDSFLQTHDETLSDLQRYKNTTYVHSFFRRTETGFELSGDSLVAIHESGCQVVARWDWHNTSSGGRWSSPQRAYRYRRPYQPTDEDDTFDTGESLVYTKLKVRGKGRAVSFRYTSEEGKDFQLLGFSVAYSANGV